MLILLNVITAIAYVINSVVSFYGLIITIAVLISWVRLVADVPYSIMRFFYAATEPVLRPIRRRLPIAWGIDFSPLVALLLVMVIRIVVVGSMLDYASGYRDRYLRELKGVQHENLVP